jgi:hypothetical protein
MSAFDEQAQVVLAGVELERRARQVGRGRQGV